jgi:hypothetical protein
MSLFFSTGVFAASRSSSKPGMVLLKPTSIAHSGTSASIGTNGQVTFTAVTSLSLNGVFSATYDNYVLAIRNTISSGQISFIRFRLSGTDSTTGYVSQYLNASSTTVDAARVTGDTFGWLGLSDSGGSSLNSLTHVNVYGPSLAQASAYRAISTGGTSSARLWDAAGTHSVATAYDGFTWYVGGGATLTGTIAVYGLRS